MLYKKISVILLASLFCLSIIGNKTYASDLFNENINAMVDNVKRCGVDTKFIDGSLRVNKIVIKRWREKEIENSLNSAYCKGEYENYLDHNYDKKVCNTFLNGDYYKEGSVWERTFNYFKKQDNNLGVKFRNIKSCGDKDELYFDKLFYKNLLEEVYIVDLVNDNSHTKTVVDNWKYNLQFLIDNYDLIKNNENANMEIIDKYIESYLSNLGTENYPDERGKSIP